MGTLDQLRIVHFRTQHPVQPHRQLPRHGHLRQRTALPLGQSLIRATPLRFMPHRTLRCFHQQPAQKRIPLLADVSQPLPTTAAALLVGCWPVRPPHRPARQSTLPVDPTAPATPLSSGSPTAATATLPVASCPPRSTAFASVARPGSRLAPATGFSTACACAPACGDAATTAARHARQA